MSNSSAPQLLQNRAIHPGRHLADELEARSLSPEELAELVRPSPGHIKRVLRGRARISERFAADLEQVLGIPAHIWCRLQEFYDEALARLAADSDIRRDVELLDKIPWREFIKRGWIRDLGTDVERVGELRTLYDANTLRDVKRSELAVAFRITARTSVDPWALAAWLQQGEWQAIERRLAEHSNLAETFEPALFEKNLRRIRRLTDSEAFWPEIRSLCAQAGVHLEYVPHIPRSGANGLTRWLDDGRPLIQLSLLRKRADIFWFTFFHEAAHVLDGYRAEAAINLDGVRRADPAERAADQFAANLLIPPDHWREFTGNSPITATAITSFADRVGIHPGIVVGRLQHEKKISRSAHNDLRISQDPNIFTADSASA